MKLLPTPATVAEQYLAAIHEVLCDIRTALVGGDQGAVARQPGDELIQLTQEQIAPAPTPPASPTKRTRARAPRTT
jgi:hypothetical protein